MRRTALSLLTLLFGAGISEMARFALPNGITILALSAGLTALPFAAAGQVHSAVACMLLAAVIDACDGRVARMTGLSSRFGAELDSLSDAICFGAVPAFILHQWGLSELGAAGWFVCLTLAAAAVLRLARFNIMAEDKNRPAWEKNYFTGVPAPAGAFLGLLPVYAGNSGFFAEETARAMACFAVPITAMLMVSTIPTFAAKSMGRKFLRFLFLPTLAVTFLAAFSLVIEPWTTLALAAAAYLMTLPASAWRHAVMRRRTEAAARHVQPVRGG
jgi:CDP-diacylglycerol--serine O-phosphatidyltransferase